MLKVDLSSWVGNTQTAQGALDENTAAMLHAIFEEDGSVPPQTGTAMQPLSHWSAFTPKVAMSQLSRDGHPKLGQFMPPVKLERRMWAGGQVEFLLPLRIGAPLERRSTITAVAEKDGDSGPMVFVTVSHDITQDGELSVTEVNNIVYLDIADKFAPPKAKPVPVKSDFDTSVEISEALLFRFSAATFNAHRIHYDLGYAQDVEKYPGLVVHGPLQAMWLMQAAMKHTDRTPAGFAFRGVHPVFHHDVVRLAGSMAEDGMKLCTAVNGTHQGMQASVTWRTNT